MQNPEPYRCKSGIFTISHFLKSTENNWRNAAFIECSACRWKRKPSCPNFLFTVQADGTPVLLPEKDAEVLFGRLIDKTECTLQLSNFRFVDLYRPWFSSHFKLDMLECPCLKLIEKGT